MSFFFVNLCRNQQIVAPNERVKVPNNIYH